MLLAMMNGGLGDSLIMSTLPELFLRERGERVNIGTINYPFRNEGIIDLVWRTNPFINDIVTSGASPTHVHLGLEINKLLLKYKNNIMAHEAYFGFEPVNRYPRIYWQPPYLEHMRHKVLLDPTAITTPFTAAAFEPFVKYHLDLEEFSKEDMILIDSGKANYDKSIFPDVPRLQPKDIFEYAALIYSCKHFLTNESGGAALASALKGANPYPKISAIMTTHSYNTRMWIWENIDYWHTGLLKGDF